MFVKTPTLNKTFIYLIISNEGPNKDIMLENAIYIILVIVCSDEGIWSKVDPCI